MDIHIKDNRIIVGINWGAIPEKGWFGATQLTGVDLDMCCFEVDQNLKNISTLNWEKKETNWGKISQDDMAGDMLGDDQQDNEWIILDLNKVSTSNVLLCTVSNYTEQSISQLSHFDYRIYCGAPNKVHNLFYSKNMKEIPIDNATKGVFLGIIKNMEGKWIYENKEILMEEFDFNLQLEHILNETTV